MNDDHKTAVGIGGVVLVAAGIGAGLFLWSGSQAATLFVLVGIPAVLILGVGVYVRGTIATSGTSQAQFTKQQARAVADEFKAAVRQLNDLETAYPAWDPGLDSRADTIAGELQTQGIEFDVDAAAYSLVSAGETADVSELERISTEVDSLEDTVEREFQDFTTREIDRLEEQLGRLTENGLVDESDLPVPPASSAPVQEWKEILDEARSETNDQLTYAVETVREIRRGEGRSEGSDEFERHLEAATEAMQTADYETAVGRILEAQDTLREEFSDSFDRYHEQVERLLSVIEETDVTRYVDAEYLEEVESVERALSKMETALDIGDLVRHRSKLRGTCIDMVAVLERSLEEDCTQLRDADLPPGYYTEPAVASESFVRELQDIEELDRFTERWRTAVTSLTGALDETQVKTAVVDVYDDIAETVENELAQSGVVTEADLPVQHGVEFFDLYSQRNPTVDFDPTVPSIRRGDVPTHTLTVEVTADRVESPGSTRLEITGAGTSGSATIDGSSGEARFEEVAEGTQTLSVHAPAELQDIQREVSISGDQHVTVELEQRSLREQVCSGEDMSDHLTQLETRLERLHEEEGYVSAGMDLPVKDDHVDCLLATWADEQDHGAVLAEDGVIVFDREDLERELSNVLRYNLSAGESISFDELTTNFLSAPVPFEVIEEVIETLDTDTEVKTSGQTIEVN